MNAAMNDTQQETLGRNQILVLSISSSILVSIGIFYLTLEIPTIITNILEVGFQDFHNWSPQAIEILDFWRPIGIVVLVLLLLLVIVGVILNRTGISKAGVLGLWLPTFGYFSISMFVLAGIGIIRVPWISLMLPYTEVQIIELGHIFYLPFFILTELNFDFILVNQTIPLILICVGLFIFTYGMATWFLARYSGETMVSNGLYRYSRHPQYLGFIIWSYGLMVYVSTINTVYGGYTTVPSLPWMIAFLTLLGIAIVEEMETRDKIGARYETYHSQTPFLFPLPYLIRGVIIIPIRLVLKETFPKSKRGILVTLLIYGIILVLLSIPVALFSYY